MCDNVHVFINLSVEYTANTFRADNSIFFKTLINTQHNTLCPYPKRQHFYAIVFLLHLESYNSI
jgi:uncharacterized protein (DUF427 family)